MSTKLSTDAEASLIGLVQSKTALYDKTHRDYKNRNAKEDTWKEISSEMISKGFDLTGNIYE
jgi:hypothetical protein